MLLCQNGRCSCRKSYPMCETTVVDAKVLEAAQVVADSCPRIEIACLNGEIGLFMSPRGANICDAHLASKGNDLRPCKDCPILI